MAAAFFITAAILLLAYISKKERCSVTANALVTRKLFPRGVELQYTHGDIIVKKNIHSDNRPSKYRVGENVQVSYNPNNPTDMYVSQYTSVKKVLSICFFAIGIFLIALWILLLALI